MLYLFPYLRSDNESLLCLTMSYHLSSVLSVCTLAVVNLMLLSLCVSGAKRVGINPKINNMIQGYEAAKYDLILISDSGIKSKYIVLLDVIYH